MSDLSARYLKNEKLNRMFYKLFKGRIYQIHEFDDLWVYQTPKAKKDWLYFPKGTTEEGVEDLVEQSVLERQDYVYKATKDTPEPDAVTEYYTLLDRGVMF